MNTLTVYGERDELSKFIKAGQGENQAFEMQQHLPCPQSLLDAVASSWSKDEPARWRTFVDDPENTYWTEEVYAVRVAEHEKQGILYKQNMKKYGHASWYDWQIANWGTKWDVDMFSTTMWEFNDYYTPAFFEGHLEILENRGMTETFEIGKQFHAYSIGYSTAWSPNEEFITTISKEYPNLWFRHKYAEGGCDFAGDNLVKEGTVWPIVTGTYCDWAVHLEFEDENTWVEDYGNEPPPPLEGLISGEITPSQSQGMQDPVMQLLMQAITGGLSNSEEE